jgi:hypothetical protein
MSQDQIDNGYTSLVFDTNNEERGSWKCLKYTISRSLAVFLSQVIVALFMIVFSCVNIYLSKRCEDSTIWIAILSSAVGYFLPNPKL